MSNTATTITSSRPKNEDKLTTTAVSYLILLSIQYAIHPTLTRNFIDSSKVCKSSVVLVQEILKFGISLFVLFFNGELNILRGFRFGIWFRFAVLPAGLYAIQNLAALQAYQNLDGVTFNILNQTKTLSAALFCYLLLQRKQSSVQIFALLILLLAALILEKVLHLDDLYLLITGLWKGSVNIFGWYYRENENDDDEEAVMLSRTRFYFGICPLLLASLISGLSGALVQKCLQVSGRNSFMYSVELCVASIIILAVSLLFTDDGRKISTDGFFHGYSLTTLIPIVNNSLGGILVGLITKKAGSVMKGFALIVGIVLSVLLQALLGSGDVNLEHYVGSMLVVLSMYLHNRFPHREKRKID
uniref:Sugar phosphate transporter domain-containing protein n=1 Tax=Leptocylindrus danicus TaxID=163516 RepID=A0A7S2KLQ9_9STRA|mmetsp:Transcript_23398/g.35114  ORF Transcript_23398/g.35114 Transcript_23398/m.35114 type:complete len:359 (+) Transcript_23398:55-1131(+)